MLKLLQPSIIHQIRVLAFLALVPLNLKQYVLQALADLSLTPVSKYALKTKVKGDRGPRLFPP